MAPRTLKTKTNAQSRSILGRLPNLVSTTVTGVMVFSVKSWERPAMSMRNPIG